LTTAIAAMEAWNSSQRRHKGAVVGRSRQVSVALSATFTCAASRYSAARSARL